ncbi:unnamed protein product [Caenorhabditis auriculariae]|uniref:Protein kinase domain-containing protein n=1 Tax=Caenorhabditis auriculariae TaxID=2777116 RepID=A0A8S1GP71_9PELO|nr:unnamed protein product [Caenorhabditis auriculariae]
MADCENQLELAECCDTTVLSGISKRNLLVESFLAKGSYATVLKGHNTDTNTQVALKIVDSKKKCEYTQRFLPRERDIWPHLSHVNVIRLHTMIDLDPYLVFVCEYAENGDLLSKIKRERRIAEPQAKRIFLQIIEALKYLHSVKVVHRDLKCENVYLDRNDNVKLGDFGFARLLEKNDNTTTFCGSRAYAAPEILSALPYDAYMSDIWSLGVVLFIMVTGCMPYNDTDAYKMLRRQIEHKVRFPSSTPISNEAKNLIYNIMDPRPNNRPNLRQICKHSWLSDTSYEMNVGVISRIKRMVHKFRKNPYSLRQPNSTRTTKTRSERQQ